LSGRFNYGTINFTQDLRSGRALAQETAFEVSLEHGVMMRVRFVRRRNRIISFVVQLECLIDDNWYPIIRYDTAHQFAHCDILRPDGIQDKRPMPVTDFNEALTYAQKDIKANFRRYRTRFEEWLNE
jgi:hypothetical protein